MGGEGLTGVSLKVVAPSGQYDPNKLVNWRSNRWSIKPEIGYSRRWRHVVLDGYAGTWFFTENDHSFSLTGPQPQTQNPVVSFEGHLSYDIKPRLWFSVDDNVWIGGLTELDGVDNPATRQTSSRVGYGIVSYQQASIGEGICRLESRAYEDWADKYKGKFDQGWDKLREEIFARQQKLALSPPIAHSRRGLHKSLRGMTCQPTSSRCSSVKWRSMPVSWSTRIIMLAAWWIRRTSGPGRLPRILVARATGRLCIGPMELEGKGELRTQFHHVIDVAPTILELAGVPQSTFVNGVQQRPIKGVSMAYSFHDAKTAEQHETQYFEMFGNRGIYHKGWTAVTRHKTPWILQGEKTPAFDDDVWELYDTNKDWSQGNNLAKQMPDKLHELQRFWLIEATRFNVLPLDDNIGARINSDLAGRPVLIKGNSQILFGSMGRLSENSVLYLKNKSHSVTAEITVPKTEAEGVIVAQGGNIGGWSFYGKGGKLKYCYKLLGIQQFYAESSEPLAPGDHQVRMEFEYAGGGLGKGGTASLFVDGKRRSVRAKSARRQRWSSLPTTVAM